MGAMFFFKKWQPFSQEKNDEITSKRMRTIRRLQIRGGGEETDEEKDDEKDKEAKEDEKNERKDDDGKEDEKNEQNEENEEKGEADKAKKDEKSRESPPRLMRAMRSGSFSSSDCMSPLGPKQLFQSPAPGIRQMGIKAFFNTPGSTSATSSGDDSWEDYGQPLPKKRRMSTIDAMKEMIRKGELEIGGKAVTLNEVKEDQIHEAAKKVQLTQKEMGRRGGRPLMKPDEMRGVYGGKRKSNTRGKNEKPRKYEMPISAKHSLCQEMSRTRASYADEAMMIRQFAKTKLMRPEMVKHIWARRSIWAEETKKHGQSLAEDVRGGRSGKEHGVRSVGNKMRLRASGGGKKKEFPELVPIMKDWLAMERSHGVVVHKMDLAVKYEELLETKKRQLQDEHDRLDEGFEKRSKAHRITLAEKQLAAMRKGYKSREKKAKSLMESIGAKHMTPNVLNPLSAEEQQVSAELAWQHHDFLMSLIVQGSSDELGKYVAKPHEAIKHKKCAVLGFSDQVPVWVKKGSTKAVFAAHETTSAAKPKDEVRKDVAKGLKDQAIAKGLVNQGNETLEDQKPDEEASLQEMHDEWQLVLADHDGKDGDGGGRVHTNIKQESAYDKYRVTFEAHQLVTNWFDHEKAPQGHVAKGVLIVPGQHARLDNISSTGRWLQDEQFQYLGVMKQHRKGESTRRALEPWVKLRNRRPELLEHFDVYSQPASNQDNIIMSWVIGKQAGLYPLSLYQRDSFAAHFSDDTMKSMFMAHQMQAIIPPRMTSAMQLTDTDFSMSFKSHVRRKVDEILKGEMRRCAQEGLGENPKMGVERMAECLDYAMRAMIKRNNEKDWVLAGLRRNGFLAMRPGEDGRMKWCGEEAWAKDKPLGSTRIHEGWLKNRIIHVKNGKIEEPNWARLEGAKELGDLVEWMYHDGRDFFDAKLDLPMVKDEDEPEWIAAGQFQLPLAIRRAAIEKDKGMSGEGHKRMAKRKSKDKVKKALRKAAKGMLDEEKKDLQKSLQAMSRHDAIAAYQPSATKKKKKMAKLMSAAKKLKKGKAKNIKKQALAKLAKKHKDKESKKDEKIKPEQPALEDKPEQPALEDKPEQPALEDKPEQPALGDKPEQLALENQEAALGEAWAGKLRVVSEHAGSTRYGRTGEVMGMGKDEVQLVMEDDGQPLWVKKAYVAKLKGDEKKNWKWPQLSISRFMKREMLLEAGLMSEDPDLQDESGEEVIVINDKEVEKHGVEVQTMALGWSLLRWFANGKSLNPLVGIDWLHPCLSVSLLLGDEAPGTIPMDKVAQAIVKTFDEKKIYLVPISAGGHWTLMVLDLREGIRKEEQIRYYESLDHESQKSKETAEILLGKLLDLGIVNEEFLNRPALARCNGAVRQKKGSNQCGAFVLAYMELEVAMALGYGPACSGWPWLSAQHWIQRMGKLGKQLVDEKAKNLKEIGQHEEKLKKQAAKMTKEREELAKAAEKELAKGNTINELQALAHKVVHESHCIQENELPDAYWTALDKIVHSGVGICSKCRYQSGCLACDENKLLGYFMRQEHKRTGRPIEYKYTLAGQIGSKVAGGLK